MLLSALVLVALAVTACARITGGRGGGGGIEHPTGADELILQVHSGGGFVPVVWHLREFPLFSLYGDGRLITEGPQIDIYPPPALPSLVERRVTEEGIQTILRAAREAGLHGADQRYEDMTVSDLPTTTFTVATGGQIHRTSVYGLVDIPGEVPVADREARQRLFRFQSQLLDLESWLPEGSVSSDRQYEYGRLQVFVVPASEAPGIGGGGDQLEPSRKAWPLQEPLSSFGEPMPNTPDIRCGTVEGADLNEVLAAAGQANVDTLWRSGGEVSLIAFRPLLPGEPPCQQQ
jgi:hypothetical protein